MAELAEKFLDLSGKEYNVLQTYDPKNKQSIWALMETNRTLQLDMRGIKMPDPVGAAMSSRFPVTFRNDQGKMITGVFTPASYNTAETDIVNGLRKIKDGIQETDGMNKFVKGYFNVILNEYAKGNKKDLRDFVNGLRVAATFDNRTVEKGFLNFAYQRTPESAQNFANDGGSVEKAIGSSAMNDLTDLLNKKGAVMLINANNVIGEGLRIDDRNSTMSSMADLLGLGHVLAKSEPATMIGEDGKEIQGTFMRKAEGMNVLEPTLDEANHINWESLTDLQDAEKGQVLRDLADIQVLDALALNTDRHPANMFLGFKEVNVNRKWKAITAMGIDNDMSYGMRGLSSFWKTGHLAALDDMKYISDSTADKVLNLDKDDFMYSLHATGRTWEEANFAAGRLDIMKDHITTGSIQRVKDDEWANINVKDMYDKFNDYNKPRNIQRGNPMEKSNIFTYAIENADSADEMFNYNLYRGNLPEALEDKVNGVVNEFNRATVKGLDAATKEIDGCVNMLELAASGDDQDIAKITELRQDLKNLQEFQENLLKRVEEARKPALVNQPNYSKDLEAVITPKDLMDIDAMHTKITEKLRVICKEPDPFVYAKKIYDTMTSLALRPEEARTAAVNTLHAQDKLKQRQGEKGLQAARLAIGLDTLKIHKEAPKLDGGHQSKTTKLAQKKIETKEPLEIKQKISMNNLVNKAAKQRPEKVKNEEPKDNLASKVKNEEPMGNLASKVKNKEPMGNLANKVKNEEPKDNLANKVKNEEPKDNLASKAAKQRPEKVENKGPVDGKKSAKYSPNKPITKVPTKSKNVMNQNNRMSPRNAGMS